MDIPTVRHAFGYIIKYYDKEVVVSSYNKRMPKVNVAREIKAIPTLYKGIWFRSRLEARWAVYFDHAHLFGFKWEYEPEGFTDGNLRYLPDFWLPVSRHYIEIKHKYPSPLEIDKAKMLVIGTGCNLIFFIGRPSVKTQSVYIQSSNGDALVLEKSEMTCHEHAVFAANNSRFGERAL